MANLVVSRVCNLRCSYCFAEDYFRGREGSPYISMETFEERLDFLERSGIDEIRLIGGEPSLHPQFPELIQRARRRDKRILLFTNGLLPETALACLLEMPPERCMVMVNVKTAEAPGPAGSTDRRRREALTRLGGRAILSYTISSPVFDLAPLRETIRATGCRRILRLGLAHPILAGQNEHLNPKAYQRVGASIAAFAPQAAEDGIVLDLDCGFVRCMFTEADLAELRRARADVGWRCNPILDVDLDGLSVFCYPLGDRVATALRPGVQADDLRAALAASVRGYRSAGIYKECSACQYLANGECTGGCLADVIKRFQPVDIHLNVPNGKDGQA